MTFTIFVADSSAHNHEAWYGPLEEMGCKVFYAAHSDAAFTHKIPSRPHLALVYHTSISEGAELSRQIKEIVPETCLVVLSSPSPNFGNPISDPQAGVDGFINTDQISPAMWVAQVKLYLRLQAAMQKSPPTQTNKTIELGADDHLRASDILGHDQVSFQNLVEEAPTAIFSQIEGKFDYLNPAALRLFGVSSNANLKGKFVLDFIAPAYKAQVSERIRLLVEERRSVPLVSEAFLRADATEVPVEVSAVPFTISGKGGALVTATDISERLELEKKLRSAERFTQETIDALSAHICVLDEKGVILSVNRAWRAFAEQNPPFDPPYWVGVNYLAVCDAVTDPTSEASQVADGIRQMMRLETVKYSLEYPCHHPNGENRWFLLTITSFLNEGAQRLVVSHQNITQRKIFEQNLIKKEELLQLTGSMAKVGGWEFDVNTGQGSWTEEVARIHDLDISTQPTANLGLSFFSGSHREKIEQAIHLAIQEGKSYDLTLEMTSAKGIHKWVRTIGTPQIDNGRVTRLKGIFQDITLQKLAEDALRESEERLRLSLQAAGQGLYDLELLTGKAIVNDEYALMLGYTPQHFVETNTFWADRLHPDERDEIISTLQDYLAGNIPEYKVEFRQRTQQGNWVWISSVGKIISRDENGRPLRMLGTHTNITQQKNSEAELVKHHATLRAVLESVNTPIFSLDHQYQYTVFNSNHADQMKARYGAEITPGQAMAKYMTDQDWQDFKPSLDQALHGETVLISTSIEIGENTPNQHFDLLLNPVYTQAGSVIGVSVFMRDITEAKKVEQALQEYNERLEKEVAHRTRQLQEAQEMLVRQERLAALGHLAGSVSHELRNPLGVISNAIYFLKNTLPDANSKTQEYLDIIDNEVHVSEKIISDLLNFSRVQSTSKRTTQIKDLVKAVLIRYPAPREIFVSINLPQYLPVVYVDPDHLHQIVGNILTNAYQAMPQGGGVYISAKVDEEFITLSVQDEGEGIPAENMGKLFEPLFTTKTHGFGLGLPLSKKLIELNGGQILVSSEVGKGSTFTLLIPIVQNQP